MKLAILGVKTVVVLMALFSALILSAEDAFTPMDMPETVDVEKEQGSVDLSQRISLDLRNMEVLDALKYISLRSGMNIVASKTVSGRVTFSLKNVPLKDIFDITLLSNSLAYEKRGAIYYVMTDKEYEIRYGEKFDDVREVKVFRLNYAVPDKAFDLLNTIKSKIGRILVDQDSGTVLIMDTAEKIVEMEETLASLERKSEVKVFTLQYATAKDVEEQLKPQLDAKNVGSVRSDERSNQVIVQAYPDRMIGIEKLIKDLDKKTKEVLIDVRIVSLTTSDNINAGFDWEGIFKVFETTLFNNAFTYVGNHPLNPIYRTGETFISQYQHPANPEGGTRVRQMPSELEGLPEDRVGKIIPAGNKNTLAENVFFGVIGRDKDNRFEYALETVINYLQTLGDTKLISNPKLAVVNNQEASIHIGRREAYITTTTTSGQTTNTVAEEVTFVDTGIKLSVTPTINDHGYVTMQIKPEVSSVVDQLITPSGNRIPIIDTSLAETTLMIKDGSTLVLGGLRRETEHESTKQIPFLGSVPLLGNLFSTRSKTKARTELLIMITPHIVGGDILITGDRGEMVIDDVKPFKEYLESEINKSVDDPYDKERIQLRLKPVKDYDIPIGTFME